MIDLDRVKKMLDGEITELVDTLHGVDLDEVDSIESQSKSKARTFRAERSRELLLLVDRLELCAAMVKKEYWFARGEDDPLDPERQA